MVSMQYMLAIELLFRVKLNIFCKIDCSIRVASILKFSCDFVYKIYFAKKRKQIIDSCVVSVYFLCFGWACCGGWVVKLKKKKKNYSRR